MKRSVFVLGDSISIGYDVYLEKYLKDICLYDRKGRNEYKKSGVPVGANGGNSSAVLDYLNTMQDSYDIFLLNCGLHDIKKNKDTGENAVSINDYADNLNKITDILLGRSSKLFWINTTWVDEETHNGNRDFNRMNADVSLYNREAEKIMLNKHVDIINLNAFTGKLGTEAFTDGVHFTENAKALQGAFIAGILYYYMEDRD